MTSLVALRCGFVLCLVVVTWLTLTPNPESAEGGMRLTRWFSELIFGSTRHADKVAHFLAYAALGALATVARIRIGGGGLSTAAALALYGAVLEVLQGWGGVREADYFDGVANAAGALSAYFSMYAIAGLRSRVARLRRSPE